MMQVATFTLLLALLVIVLAAFILWHTLPWVILGVTLYIIGARSGHD